MLSRYSLATFKLLMGRAVLRFRKTDVIRFDSFANVRFACVTLSQASAIPQTCAFIPVRSQLAFSEFLMVRNLVHVLPLFWKILFTRSRFFANIFSRGFFHCVYFPKKYFEVP